MDGAKRLIMNENIRLIEELSANAWPAAVVEDVDGWRLRFDSSVTRRANSVWPNDDGRHLSLAKKMAAVEEFYARRKQPVCYEISPAAQPPDLDAVLAERGYQAEGRTCVRSASMANVMARTQHDRDHVVAVADRFDEEWFRIYCQAEQVSERAEAIRSGILQRIVPRTGYALLRHEGKPIAIGFGVLERKWVGVFSMATRPEFRRQGAGVTVLHALAKWGHEHGATQMYLQVLENNGVAMSLYEHAGFETLYHFHYRKETR